MSSLQPGLGEARNALVVGSAAAVIAVDGEYGTLSEIALALRAGIPVIGLGTWLLTRPDGRADTGVVAIEDPERRGDHGHQPGLRPVLIWIGFIRVMLERAGE